MRTCAPLVLLGLCPKLKYPPLCGGIFILMLLIAGTEGAIGRKTAFFIANKKRYSPVSAASFCVNVLVLSYHHVCAHFFEQGKVLLRCSLVILYAEDFGVGGAVFKRGIDAVHHAGINY